MAEKICFQTPQEARLKTALRELVEKAQTLCDSMDDADLNVFRLVVEKTILKAKEALGEKA